ncbi:VgrG-related protein [Actinokineospora inagensis]|uniref:VgrG-related protein n=1 Tax=Actinokineospora inagensis TaxID=103730 RepID=UPI0004214635|nr:VgrG-related protein [Actinokineospora inagensis]
MSLAARLYTADPIVSAPAPLTEKWFTKLVSCTIDESVGLPNAAILTYSDDNNELLADTGITIGTRLEVAVSTVAGTAQEQLFTGEVTALELDKDGSGAYTVIHAMSVAHRLFRGRKVEAFRNMTASDVVRKVAKGAGLPVGRVELSPVTYTQLSQAAVSDWDFLSQLAYDHGVLLRVDDKGVLQMTKPEPASKAPAPTAENNPLVMDYRGNTTAVHATLTSADQVKSVEVRAWDVKTKRAFVAVEPSLISKTVQPGLSPSARFGPRARLLVADTPHGTQAETDAMARGVAASAAAGYGELEVVVEGNPKFRAGTPVALGNAGEAFSGKYTATAVRHVLEPRVGYRTTVTVSASADRSLAGLVAGANAPARSPRLPGLAIGVVTDIKDPTNRGGVRLRFPWLDDNYVTDWVRTVQWGGVRGGGVFSPEVNDEVLVGFEQGSLDRPYVLGGLYNGLDKPSEHDVPLVDAKSGRVNRRSLVSRTGNRVELLDATTKSGVRIASGDKRLEVVLDEKNGRIDVRVRGRGGGRILSSLRMDDRGITVDAKRGSLVLKGQSVSVEATGAATVQGGTAAVEARGLAKLKGLAVEIN